MLTLFCCMPHKSDFQGSENDYSLAPLWQLSVFENVQTFLLIERKHGTFNTRGRTTLGVYLKTQPYFPWYLSLCQFRWKAILYYNLKCPEVLLIILQIFYKANFKEVNYNFTVLSDHFSKAIPLHVLMILFH